MRVRCQSSRQFSKLVCLFGDAKKGFTEAANLSLVNGVVEEGPCFGACQREALFSNTGADSLIWLNNFLYLRSGSGGGGPIDP